MDTTAIVAIIAAVFLGCGQLLQIWLNSKNQKKLDAVAQIQKEQSAVVNAVAQKTEVIHLLVNGPLGKALSDDADSKLTVARLQPTQENIDIATRARQRSDDHVAAKAMSDAEMVKTAVTQQKAIDLSIPGEPPKAP